MSKKLLLQNGEALLQEDSGYILIQDSLFTIGGVDISAYIDWASVQIRQILTKNGDELTFKIKKYGTKTYTPELNEEVIVIANGYRVFGGYVVQISNDINGLAMEQTIVCKDYSFALENQLITKTYESTTVEAIVLDLISSYAPDDFTVANVSAPAPVTKIVFNYISFSQCMKKLAEGLTGYEWYVDYTKGIHFFSVGTVIAPFQLTDTSDNYLVNTLELTSDISQIANDITIRGGKVTASSPRTEYWSGDGTRTEFPLANDFVGEPTVAVGGVAQTVGLDGVEDDANFDFMWNQNSQLVRSTAGNTAGAGTNNIEIVGTPQFPLIFRKQNQISIAEFGSRPKFIKQTDIQDVTTASKRADAELAAFSMPTYSGSFVTYEAGLAVGQYINVNSTIRGINRFYKIQNIAIGFRTPLDPVYKVSLESAGSTTINDILAQLLITDPASLVDASLNDTIERISLFSEEITVLDSTPVVTTSTGPYLYDDAGALYNLSTWA